MNTAVSRAPRTGVISVPDLIFLILCAQIVLRFTMSADLMNQFVPYTLPGGNPLMKFHPSSFLCAPLLLLIPYKLKKSLFDVRIATIAAALLLVAALLILRGRGAAASVVIDSYFAPALFTVALARLSMEHIKRVMLVFVAIAAANVAIVAFEFVTRSHVVPSLRDGRFFRPKGLFGHPIAAGTLFYLAMLIVTTGAVSNKWARPLALLFLFGVALCGVRGPLAIAVAIFLLHTARHMGGRKGTFDHVWDMSLFFIVPACFIAALYVGALDRILTLGVWGHSAQTRIDAFAILSLLTEEQLWNGVRNYEVISMMTQHATEGRFIENPFVLFTLNAGILFASIMMALLVAMHLRTILISPLFIGIMLVLFATTLSFATKNMAPFALVIAGFWLRAVANERRAGAAARRRSSIMTIRPSRA